MPAALETIILPDRRCILERLCSDVLHLPDEELRQEGFDLFGATNGEAMTRFHFLVSVSACTDPILMFMGDAVVTGHERHLHFSHFSTYARTGQRRQFVNELIPPGFSCRADDLRDFFGTLELLVFQIVQIAAPDVSRTYKLRNGKFGKRVSELRRKRIISENDEELLDRIGRLRGEFAHFATPTESLPYEGQPLRLSFRPCGKGYEAGVEHFFIVDAFAITERLISVFKRVQARQIDIDQFIGGVRFIRDFT